MRRVAKDMCKGTDVNNKVTFIQVLDLASLINIHKYVPFAGSRRVHSKTKSFFDTKNGQYSHDARERHVIYQNRNSA